MMFQKQFLAKWLTLQQCQATTRQEWQKERVTCLQFSRHEPQEARILREPLN